MSTFITAEDYRPYITDARLTQILGEGIPASPILEDAEATAVAVVTDALSDRFDTEAIFALVDDDRPRSVVRWCVCLILYFLYERIADKLVPERVVFNYKETLTMLEAISEGKKNVALPRLVDAEGEETTKFRWGSETKRSH